MFEVTTLATSDADIPPLTKIWILSFLEIQATSCKLLSAVLIICSSSCDPIDDKRGTIEFRSHVAGVLAKRAIILAHSRAGDKIEKIAR